MIEQRHPAAFQLVIPIVLVVLGHVRPYGFGGSGSRASGTFSGEDSSAVGPPASNGIADGSVAGVGCAVGCASANFPPASAGIDSVAAPGVSAGAGSAPSGSAAGSLAGGCGCAGSK